MPRQVACQLCGRSFERSGRARSIFCKPCNDKASLKVGRVLTVQCAECGGKFSTRTRSARYCSDGCRLEAKRRKGREYVQKYLADPEKRARFMARSRAYAAAKRDRRRKEKGRRRERPTAGRGAARLPRAAPNSGKQMACRLCGAAFAPYGGIANRTYCRACTAKTDRDAARVLTVRCKECGKKFSTKSRTVRYCSAQCSTEGRRRSGRGSRRRSMADPENRAVAAARIRAWSAAQRDKKGGGRHGGGGARARGTA